nr:DUF3164 family protein [Vibrio parahaemolyticus]
MTEQKAPKGMRLNKDGNPVPERIIDPYKIEQDDFVNALIAKAKGSSKRNSERSKSSRLVSVLPFLNCLVRSTAWSVEAVKVT